MSSNSVVHQISENSLQIHTDHLNSVEVIRFFHQGWPHRQGLLCEPRHKTCQAQTILANREQWASELAKQIAHHHQSFRSFVERPTSDVSLLEALTASVTATAAGAAPAEDLFAPPAAKSAAAAPPQRPREVKGKAKNKQTWQMVWETWYVYSNMIDVTTHEHTWYARSVSYC